MAPSRAGPAPLPGNGARLDDTQVRQGRTSTERNAKAESKVVVRDARTQRLRLTARMETVEGLGGSSPGLRHRKRSSRRACLLRAARQRRLRTRTSPTFHGGHTKSMPLTELFLDGNNALGSPTTLLSRHRRRVPAKPAMVADGQGLPRDGRRRPLTAGRAAVPSRAPRSPSPLSCPSRALLALLLP